MANVNEDFEGDQILEGEPVNREGEDHYQETYEEDSLHKLLIDLGGETDAEMRIYKQPGDGRSKMAYLFAASPGDYTYGQLLEKVKNEYGGGDYRIHVRQDKRIVVNRQFSVAEVKQPENNQNNSNQNMEMLQERFENKLEKMQSEHMRMFERLIDNLSNQDKGPSPAEMQKQTMEMLVQMKQLTSEDDDKKKPKEKSPFEQMKEFMELQSLMRESMPSDREPASGDILLNAISQFGPAFQKLMGQQGQQGQQPNTGQLPAPQNPQPQNPGEQPQPESQPQNGEENPQMENIQALGQHLQVLLMAAQQNGDPISYANVVMDFTEEENIRKIHEFLTQDDCVEQLAQAFPQMAEHFQNEQVYNWFHDLRKELISLIRSDYPDLQPTPEPVTTGEENTGDSGNDDHGATDGDSER